MVGPLVDWVGAVVGCLAEVVRRLWMMVGGQVEWAAMEAVMDCLAEVVGSLWVMVGALMEWAAMKVLLECPVVNSSSSLYHLFVSFP